MILGVMQPYFFPYLGYFALIRQTTRWIVFDTPQYIRHGWINRNRILHPSNGWQYVTVPLMKAPRETSIDRMCIRPEFDRGRKLLAQLDHYRRRAPHFEAVRDLVERCLDTDEASLSRLNATCLARVCDYLEVPFRYELFSEMDLELGRVDGPWDWAPRIAKAVGATEYVNAPGAGDRFDRKAFADAGIRFSICEVPALVYDTPGYEFVPDLSIIDVLMWNSSRAVREHLESRGREIRPA